jgi:RimJ/RimL family protein N-acetyltransferase
VRPDNERAIRFYEKCGWSPDGVDRRVEVLGVEVPETRLSVYLSQD